MGQLQLSVSALRKRIAAGEGSTLDFKKTISSAQKIAKTLVAFANHEGGSLLVGVTDNGKICGVDAEEDIYMIESAANFFCKPAVNYQTSLHSHNGLTVLEIIVPKSDHKPHAAKGEDNKWWVYVRVNDQSVLASRLVVDVLRKEASGEPSFIQYTSKEQALIEYLTANQRITLREYCKLVNISFRRARRILVELVTAGVIRIHTTEKQEFYTLS